MASKGARRPTDPKSIEDVISATKQTLAFAQMGLSDLVASEDRARQVEGLMDVMTYGRAVTTVLAHIKTFDRQGWEAWWAPRQANMRADPLCRFFYERRSIVLKDGTLAVWETNRLYEPEIFPPMTFASLGSTGPLPDATSLPYGDYYKSSHIETRIVGQRSLEYVPLPRTQSSRLLMLGDPPTQHMGGAIVDLSAQMLATLYIHHLARIHRSFAGRRRFRVQRSLTTLTRSRSTGSIITSPRRPYVRVAGTAGARADRRRGRDRGDRVLLRP